MGDGPGRHGRGPGGDHTGAGRILVAGSYPPVPGQGAARTLVVVRDALRRGEQVTVLSPRPSAAERFGRLVGWRSGLTLWWAGRKTGARQLVVCVEPGLPVPLDAGHLHTLLTLTAIRLALSGFSAVTVVDALDPDFEVSGTPARVVKEIAQLARKWQAGADELPEPRASLSGPSEWQRGQRARFALALLEHHASRRARALVGTRAPRTRAALRRVLDQVRRRTADMAN